MLTESSPRVQLRLREAHSVEVCLRLPFPLTLGRPIPSGYRPPPNRAPAGEINDHPAMRKVDGLRKSP